MIQKKEENGEKYVTATTVAEFHKALNRGRAVELTWELGDEIGLMKEDVGTDVGRSQQGAEQMAGAEDIERQVAVAPVVAVKEPVLLLTVEGIVGGVEVEDDLIGRLRVGLGEQFHQQGLQGLGVVVDLVVAVGAFAGGKFESVQSALARQGSRVFAGLL